MLDGMDKRDFARMDIECPAQFSVQGESGSSGAVVKNLSGGGLLLWMEREIGAGDYLDIEVAPMNAITPPMKVRVKVVRCTPVEGVNGQFAVACATEQILS